jgi:hypothetical protein
MPPALSLTFPGRLPSRDGERRDDAPACVTRTNATADCAEQVPRQAGEHGKITQKFASTLSTSDPPGQQRAAATGRQAYPAEAHGRPERKPRPPVYSLPLRPAGARQKRSLAMCAQDDVSPGARYCDKALPRRTIITRLRTPHVITPTPGPGPSVADRQRQPMAVNARPEWRTEQPIRRDRHRPPIYQARRP